MISELATFVCGIPDRYNKLLSCPPPVKPISVWEASPGPLTTHPIMDKFIGFFIWDNLFSKVFTVSITGNAWRAQDGHEIIFTPLDLIPSDLRIS
mgnify:CR=1 FL=1